MVGRVDQVTGDALSLTHTSGFKHAAHGGYIWPADPWCCLDDPLWCPLLLLVSSHVPRHNAVPQEGPHLAPIEVHETPRQSSSPQLPQEVEVSCCLTSDAERMSCPGEVLSDVNAQKPEASCEEFLTRCNTICKHSEYVLGIRLRSCHTQF